MYILSLIKKKKSEELFQIILKFIVTTFALEKNVEENLIEGRSQNQNSDF